MSSQVRHTKKGNTHIMSSKFQQVPASSNKFQQVPAREGNYTTCPVSHTKKGDIKRLNKPGLETTSY